MQHSNLTVYTWVKVDKAVLPGEYYLQWTTQGV